MLWHQIGVGQRCSRTCDPNCRGYLCPIAHSSSLLQKQTKSIKNLLRLSTCSDLCVLAVRPESSETEVCYMWTAML